MNRTGKNKVVVVETSSSSASSEFNNDSLDGSSAEFEQEEIITDEIIFPGLMLNDDYVLLKKIGYGNNAGVWMAYRISTKSYFAIKIQDHECYDDGCREIKILKKINEFIGKNNDVETYCVNMFDCFKYSEQKDDGIVFVCSVYDLYAGSIDTLITTGIYKYGLPIPVVKKITKQLLISLDVLHNKLNIVHTDIKPENILLKGIPIGHKKIIETFEKSKFQEQYNKLQKKHCKNPDALLDKIKLLAIECVAGLDDIQDPFLCRPQTLSDEEDDSGSIISGEEDDFEDGSNESSSEESSEEETQQCFNLNRRQSVDDLVEHLYSKEKHDLEEYYDFVSVLNNKNTTTDTKKIINDDCVYNCEIAITDFGNSYFYEKRTKHEIQDRRYRAPEVVMAFNYGYACDMWSVGCLVFELLTGFTLFAPYDEPLTKDIHHMYLMESMLGPIPVKMKKTSKRQKFLFNHKNKFNIKGVEKIDRISIKERLIKQFLFSEPDADDCSNFILMMLKYNPPSRGTAKSMLTHKWLTNV